MEVVMYRGQPSQYIEQLEGGKMFVQPTTKGFVVAAVRDSHGREVVQHLSPIEALRSAMSFDNRSPDVARALRESAAAVERMRS